eukprot:scaffold25652_cov108-Cylindrotheca_fusiformis.AAC.1
MLISLVPRTDIPVFIKGPNGEVHCWVWGGLMLCMSCPHHVSIHNKEHPKGKNGVQRIIWGRGMVLKKITGCKPKDVPHLNWWGSGAGTGELIAATLSSFSSKSSTDWRHNSQLEMPLVTVVYVRCEIILRSDLKGWGRAQSIGSVLVDEMKSRPRD